MNLTWEKFETVYQSKHHAALFLHQAMELNPQKDLRFLWNFSSTSVYGNMGQLNYSGSNSFLDVLTRHRKVPAQPNQGNLIELLALANRYPKPLRVLTLNPKFLKHT